MSGPWEDFQQGQAAPAPPPGPWADFNGENPGNGATAPMGAPVQAAQLSPTVYAQPIPYDKKADPSNYVWDWRLPDPGQGMAWPRGTVPDPKANDAGNSAVHLPGDKKPYFGRPRVVFGRDALGDWSPQSSSGDAVNDVLSPGKGAPDVGTDLAKTAPAGLARGMTALVGAPGDLSNMAERGLGWLYNRGMEALGPDLGGWSHYHAALLDHAGANVQKTGYFPTSQTLNAGVARVAGPLYEPQTQAGKFLNSAEELLPSTIAGGEGLVNRVVPALVGGTAGQLAADATKGTAAEPYGRLVGTVLGAWGGGAATGTRTAEKMMAGGARGATQQQIDLAQQLMQRAEDVGVRISGPEALNQVAGGAFPGLARVQRVAEGTREGQAIFGPLMADRPRQLADALHATVLDPLAPPRADPSALGAEAQDAATSTLRTLEQARTAAVNPHYAAAASDTVPADQMEQLLQRMDADIAADKTGIVGKHLADVRDLLTDRPAVAPNPGDPLDGIPPTPGSPRVPITDIGNLDRIRKYVRDTVGARTVGQDAIPAEQAGQISSYLDHLNGLMEANSPAFRQGKSTFADISDRYVTPATSGPLGTISRTGDTGAQVSALYPRSPLEGAANETAQAIRAMRGVNDGAYDQIPADLTRQHLVGSWNEASRGAVPDQWVGARWFKNTMGNPEQRANLLTGVSVAGHPDIGSALSDFGDIAQATGYRARHGSATAFNERDLHDMQGGGPLGKVAGLAMDPLEIGKVLKDGFDRWKLGRNAESLANSTVGGTAADRAKALADALKNQPNSLAGWATKLLLYDNPVIPGRKEKPDAP